MIQTIERRTRETVLREYGEEKWPRFEGLVAEHIAADPDADFARVLARVAREQWRREVPLAAAPFRAAGKLVAMPPSGAFGAAQGIVVETVLAACDHETDVIVELGAGWGWHILTLWARGGPTEALYVAAELTDAGRRAATALAALDGDLRFRALPFDYHEPSFEALGRHRHAVVFTAHSIEQIPEIQPALLPAIRDLADRVTCLHFEPVGWQMGRRGGTTAAYARRHDYNRNLVGALRDEADAGALTIDDLQPDVFGINPDNATTIIRWHTETAA